MNAELSGRSAIPPAACLVGLPVYRVADSGWEGSNRSKCWIWSAQFTRPQMRRNARSFRESPWCRSPRKNRIRSCNAGAKFRRFITCVIRWRYPAQTRQIGIIFCCPVPQQLLKPYRQSQQFRDPRNPLFPRLCYRDSLGREGGICCTSRSLLPPNTTSVPDVEPFLALRRLSPPSRKISEFPTIGRVRHWGVAGDDQSKLRDHLY